VARPRRLALLAALVAALVAPAGLADLSTEQESVDARIDALEQEIDEAKRRETVLTTDLAAAAERIDAIQADVNSTAAELDALERSLAKHRARLDRLRDLYAEQTRQLGILEQSEAIAQARLEQRLVDLYENEPPDEIEIILLSRSLSDLISQLEYLGQIARHDQEIAEQARRAKEEVGAAREQTAATKAEEAVVTADLAEETALKQAALDRLVRRRDQLVAAGEDRESLLATVRASRHEAEEDLGQLERQSAELAERIRAAQSRAPAEAPQEAPPASAGGAPSASSFIWPVDGPITSGFGTRWGRLHAGIDIGVGFGTPIRAAAAGTVIHAGWLGGYGNLVVIDHGGGLSTAYGHQQAIYVTTGKAVAQGEVIGEVGSTGNSTGPHLHFEVRVGGSPVDPLGYL
jgi:murein DD-endopeptidase MepM/ murein hydrolase activator NlpD